MTNADFESAVHEHQGMVYSIAFHFFHNAAIAEEVAQDVFVKAFRSLADFRGNSKFSTWLYTITTTTCITFLRKKKLDIHSLDNEKVFEAADSKDSGFRANMIEQKSRVNMVNEAIAMLSPDDAEVITLFYKAEQNLEEIARILRIEPNTAKVRLHRARGRLKEKMEKHFSEEVKNIY